MASMHIYADLAGVNQGVGAVNMFEGNKNRERGENGVKEREVW